MGNGGSPTKNRKEKNDNKKNVNRIQTHVKYTRNSQ